MKTFVSQNLEISILRQGESTARHNIYSFMEGIISFNFFMFDPPGEVLLREFNISKLLTCVIRIVRVKFSSINY